MAVIENIRSVDVVPVRTQPVSQPNSEFSRERDAVDDLRPNEENAQVSAKAEPSPPPSEETLTKAVQQMNSFLSALNKRISFFFDEASGRNGVKVIDRKTHEVVKQIPPEEVLKTAARIRQMVGALLDEIA